MHEHKLTKIIIQIVNKNLPKNAIFYQVQKSEFNNI